MTQDSKKTIALLTLAIFGLRAFEHWLVNPNNLILFASGLLGAGITKQVLDSFYPPQTMLPDLSITCKSWWYMMEQLMIFGTGAVLLKADSIEPLISIPGLLLLRKLIHARFSRLNCVNPELTDIMIDQFSLSSIDNELSESIELLDNLTELSQDSNNPMINYYHQGLSRSCPALIEPHAVAKEKLAALR